MDDRAFDRLSRLLATAASRRGAAGALLAALAAVPAVARAQRGSRRQPDADAVGRAPCLPVGRACRGTGCRRCCTGYNVRDGGGGRKCWCKGKGAACEAADACCGPRCLRGRCAGVVAAGLPCTRRDACAAGATCQPYDAGSGGPAGSWCLRPRGAACADDGECASDACHAGACIPSVCRGGCAAPTPDCCAGGCTDISSDEDHCGACGNACGVVADSCVGGACRCGGDPACTAGLECRGGVCGQERWTNRAVFGRQGVGADQFDFPHDVALRGDLVFVADSFNHRVAVWKETRPGRWAAQFTLGGFGIGDDQFDQPVAVAVVGDRLFVTDKNNARVSVWKETNGTWAPLARFGGPGAGDAQFDFPEGIAVVGDRVFVADTGNNRVSIWKETNGVWAPEARFGAFGSNLAQFSAPRDVAPAAGNDATALFVTDFGNDRVVFWQNASAGWQPVFQLGNGPGSEPDKIDSPVGIAVVGDWLFVDDHENDRVSIWRRAATGVWVPEARFGSKGNGDEEFDDPAGLAVDAGGRVVVADLANHRVSVWSFGFAPGS